MVILAQRPLPKTCKNIAKWCITNKYFSGAIPGHTGWPRHANAAAADGHGAEEQ